MNQALYAHMNKKKEYWIKYNSLKKIKIKNKKNIIVHTLPSRGLARKGWWPQWKTNLNIIMHCSSDYLTSFYIERCISIWCYISNGAQDRS
jgi:UDP-N-acetylglucosamine:LPS N-acetylglucosamine transferase